MTSSLLAVLLLSPPVPTTDADPAQRRALAVLEKYCHRCHGKDGSNEGQMGYVLDPKALVENKVIVPGDAAKSKLSKRAAEGEMPPEGETPRPDKPDIDALKEWINGLKKE